MSRDGKIRRSVIGAFTSAVLGSALAVVVNLATEWKYDVVAWLVVVVLTVLTAVTSLLLTRDAGGPSHTNDLRFGNQLRTRRMRVRGQRNALDVGDNATIDDIDVSSGESPSGPPR